MTISTLDPKTALIVVDLQKGIIAHPCAHPMDDIVQNASKLASAFRQHNLPVVLVKVIGTAHGRTQQALSQGQRPTDWAELSPVLNQQPQDLLIEKRTWGAFTNTDLEVYLKGQDVTQVVVVGVATSIGVESTARHAYELGFNVTLAVDAITDRSANAHENSVSYIFPRLGESGSTQEVIDLLNKREV